MVINKIVILQNMVLIPALVGTVVYLVKDIKKELKNIKKYL